MLRNKPQRAPVLTRKRKQTPGVGQRRPDRHDPLPTLPRKQLNPKPRSVLILTGTQTQARILFDKDTDTQGTWVHPFKLLCAVLQFLRQVQKKRSSVKKI